MIQRQIARQHGAHHGKLISQIKMHGGQGVHLCHPGIKGEIVPAEADYLISGIGAGIQPKNHVVGDLTGIDHAVQFAGKKTTGFIGLRCDPEMT